MRHVKPFDKRLSSGHVVVACSYRYQGRQHAFSVLIDHMMGGVAKNASATTKIDELFTTFPLTSISQTEAHDLLTQAYELTYQHGFLHVDPDVHHSRFPIRRRLQL